MPATWGLSAQGFKTKDIHTIKRELTEALQQNIDPNLSCGPDTVLVKSSLSSPTKPAKYGRWEQVC